MLLAVPPGSAAEVPQAFLMEMEKQSMAVGVQIAGV